MRRLWLLLLSFALITLMPSHAYAQGGNTVIIRFAGAPTGSCSVVAVAVNNATGDFYDCLSSSWHAVGGAATGITGTLTSGKIPVASGTHTLADTSGLSESGTVFTLTDTLLGKHSSTSTAQATYEFMGTGSGTIAGFPSIVDIAGEDTSPWYLTMRNKADAPRFLSIFPPQDGDWSIANISTSTVDGPTLLLQANQSIELTWNGGMYLAGFTRAAFPIENECLTGNCGSRFSDTIAQTRVGDPPTGNNPLVILQSGAGIGGIGAGLVFIGGISGAAQIVVPDIAGANTVLTLPTTTGTFALAGTAITAPTISTTANCSSAASPAVCAAAAAGSVVIAAGATTVVVNTTAVTANSQILVFPDETLGTKLGVTCNSTLATAAAGLAITARTAATSFTVSTLATVAVNPVCLSYMIVN